MDRPGERSGDIRVDIPGSPVLPAQTTRQITEHVPAQLSVLTNRSVLPALSVWAQLSEHYEPVADEDRKDKYGIGLIVANLIIGNGFLSMPYCFAIAGWLGLFWMTLTILATMTSAMEYTADVVQLQM